MTRLRTVNPTKNNPVGPRTVGKIVCLTRLDPRLLSKGWLRLTSKVATVSFWGNVNPRQMSTTSTLCKAVLFNWSQWRQKTSKLMRTTTGMATWRWRRNRAKKTTLMMIMERTTTLMMKSTMHRSTQMGRATTLPKKTMKEAIETVRIGAKRRLSMRSKTRVWKEECSTRAVSRRCTCRASFSTTAAMSRIIITNVKRRHYQLGSKSTQKTTRTARSNHWSQNVSL